jgi:hypothetical protein
MVEVYVVSTMGTLFLVSIAVVYLARRALLEKGYVLEEQVNENWRVHRAQVGGIMKQVSQDKWRDGVKFLAGLGVGPTLTLEEQIALKKRMLDRGMSDQEAAVTLHSMGWIRR